MESPDNIPPDNKAIEDFWRTFIEHEHVFAIPDGKKDNEGMKVLESL